MILCSWPAVELGGWEDSGDPGREASCAAGVSATWGKPQIRCFSPPNVYIDLSWKAFNMKCSNPKSKHFILELKMIFVLVNVAGRWFF